MGIGERISHLQLKHKLLLPNILYLILFIAVLFFFIKSNEMIKGIARDQQASFTLSEKIRQTALDTKRFINKEISYPEIQKEYEEVLAGSTRVIWCKELQPFKRA
jgi:methyl-accepting chemotaxis protein